MAAGDQYSITLSGTRRNLVISKAIQKFQMKIKNLLGWRNAQGSVCLGQSRIACQRVIAMLAIMMGLTGANATSATEDKPVQVISAKKIKSLEWLWSVYATMTFSSDGVYFLLGEIKPDGYVHLCAYETATLAPLKCVVRLYKSKGSYHGQLDWPDDRLFIQAGGFDESFVGWVNIQGWQEATFKEVDGLKQMRYVNGKQGMYPLWDRKESGLYYRDVNEAGGIYFEKNDLRMKRFKEGESASPGDKYIWYTEIAPPRKGKVSSASLRRMDRTTKNIEILSDGYQLSTDNAFTVSHQDHVLFLRREGRLNEGMVQYSNARIYTYIEKRGMWGPVYGPANNGEIKFIRVSPNGDRALVSVHDEGHSKPGRNRHHIYLLELRWVE